MRTIDNHYARIHIWIRSHYGKATTCIICNGKNSTNFEWALKRECEYEKNIENFMQLCVSCHRKYDYTEEQRMKLSIRMKEALKTGKIKNPNNNKGKFEGEHQCAKAILQLDKNTNEIIQEYPSLTTAVRLTGIKQNTLSMCLSGKNKTAKGYKWKFK